MGGMAVVASIFGFLSASASQAQSPDGNLRGRITDGGKVSSEVTGARVELAGTTLRTSTDSTGRFVFPALPAATYTVVVTPAAKSPLRRTVKVASGAVTEITLDLREGPATLEPLVVTAARPLHVIGHLPASQDNVIYA